jgi:phospholipid/cholesterol/gamma-HCH transport system substrate-binding protein
MKSSKLEFVVGLFLALGILCLGYLSIKVARREFIAGGGYDVQAVFTNCSGLRRGSPVLIAGVEVGRIKQIVLQDYAAKVEMVLQPGIVLQKDTIASIRTKGLIGEKFIELTPGASEEKIQPGGTIHDTEPALDLEGLISKFVHGNVSKPADSAAGSNSK